MVLRVRPTPTRFPMNIIYTPMDNIPLYSMWHFRTDSLLAGYLFRSQHVCITISLFRSQSYFLFIVTLNCVSMREREIVLRYTGCSVFIATPSHDDWQLTLTCEIDRTPAASL